MTTHDEHRTREAASTYFAAWREKDFTRFRAVLADDVDFRGPFGHVVGGDACATAMEGLGGITTDVAVQHVFVDGADVLTWFELHTTVADDPIPVANWSRVEDGRITRIRVAFDPRSLAG